MVPNFHLFGGLMDDSEGEMSSGSSGRVRDLSLAGSGSVKPTEKVGVFVGISVDESEEGGGGGVVVSNPILPKMTFWS